MYGGTLVRCNTRVKWHPDLTAPIESDFGVLDPERLRLSNFERFGEPILERILALDARFGSFEC